MAAYDVRPDHQGRADFWLGFIFGWFSCATLLGGLAVVAWIGGN